MWYLLHNNNEIKSIGDESIYPWVKKCKQLIVKVVLFRQNFEVSWALKLNSESFC